MTVDRKDDTVAAAGFVAFLALTFGGAGVVIAAIALGVERAWDTRHGAGTAGDRRRDRVADHRAWLDYDRERDNHFRRARRTWLLDPDRRAEDEPQPPAHRIRAGWWLRRWTARLALAWDAFVDGYRDGREAAQRVRRGGGTFADIVAARPQPQLLPEPAADAPSVVADDPKLQAWQPDPNLPYVRLPDLPLPTSVPQRTSEGAPAMTQQTQTVGETHADLTVADLDGVQHDLARVTELNDQLAAVRTSLQGRLATAQERVDLHGGTTATAQALDAARAVVEQIGAQVNGLADSTVEAAEQTSAAHAGAKPALDAQDGLHAAGARGEYVATATSD